VIEFDPQVYVVRLFNEETGSFDAVLTLHKVEALGVVVGMHGMVDRAAYRGFMAKCKELGIKKLVGYRHEDDEPTYWDVK